MSIVQIQGKRATKQGKKFEDIVASQLDVAGAKYERQVRLANGSIFGKTKVIDFLITNSARYPNGLYMEIKWQDSSGTAEEKIPYSVACIKKCYDLPTVLLLGGSGLTDGCISWAISQKGGKLIEVMHEHDLTRFCMRNGFIKD